MDNYNAQRNEKGVGHEEGVGHEVGILIHLAHEMQGEKDDQ